MKRILFYALIIFLFNAVFLPQAYCARSGDTNTVEAFKPAPYNFVPVPPLANEIKSEKVQMAGTEMIIILYSSESPFREIAKFYRERMPREGWEEVSPGLVGDSLIFKKTEEMVNIKNLPSFNPKETVFSLSKGRIPSAEEVAESGGSNIEFKDIPLYPNATDIPFSSMRTPGKEQTGYSTTDSVEKVLRFYSEKLPAYGWTIESQMPLNDYKGGDLRNCPDCQKLPKEALDRYKSSSVKMAALNISKDGKLCFISCTQVQQSNQVEQNTLISISCNR